jgi:hypothetical protein
MALAVVTVIAASICEAVRRTSVATRTVPLQPAGATTTPPSGNDKHETEQQAGTVTTGQNAEKENEAAAGVAGLTWVGGVAVLAAIVF